MLLSNIIFNTNSTDISHLGPKPDNVSVIETSFTTSLNKILISSFEAVANCLADPTCTCNSKKGDVNYTMPVSVIYFNFSF